MTRMPGNSSIVAVVAALAGCGSTPGETINVLVSAQGRETGYTTRGAGTGWIKDCAGRPQLQGRSLTWVNIPPDAAA